MSNMLLMSDVQQRGGGPPDGRARGAGRRRHPRHVLLRRLALPDSRRWPSCGRGTSTRSPRRWPSPARPGCRSRPGAPAPRWPATPSGAASSLDFSRHLNRVLEVDPQARTAVVEPGTVHAVLQKAVAPHGVRFGPDPSTHPRCTIGGMIGNNACGSRSLAYGRTSDNVAGPRAADRRRRERLDHRDSGEAPWVQRRRVGARRRTGGRRRPTWPPPAPSSTGSAGRSPATPLQHLLPERFDLTRALVGSEGTLAVITQATVRLVVDAPVRVVVVLGFPDIVAAGEAAPAVVAHGPTSCEGLDSRLLDVLRARRGPDAVPPLPRGRCLALRRAGRRRAGRGARPRARRLAADGIGVDSAGGRGPGHPGQAVADPRGRRRPGRAGARPTGRRGRAGRTPPSRRSGWAPTWRASTSWSTRTT